MKSLGLILHANLKEAVPTANPRSDVIEKTRLISTVWHAPSRNPEIILKESLFKKLKVHCQLGCVAVSEIPKTVRQRLCVGPALVSSRKSNYSQEPELQVSEAYGASAVWKALFDHALQLDLRDYLSSDFLLSSV